MTETKEHTLFPVTTLLFKAMLRSKVIIKKPLLTKWKNQKEHTEMEVINLQQTNKGTRTLWRIENLKCDGCQGGSHASVEGSRAFFGNNIAKNGEGRTSLWILLQDSKSVKWIPRYYTSNATKPSCHKFLSPTACKKFRPEIHFPIHQTTQISPTPSLLIKTWFLCFPYKSTTHKNQDQILGPLPLSNSAGNNHLKRL